MERKIKKIMDNLDYDETQSLLEGIDVKKMNCDSDDEQTLNYDRIAKMVYEKTGVKKKKVINFRKYASMAAVACIGFLIGLATMSIGINLGSNNNVEKDTNRAASEVADANDGKDKYQDDAAEGSEWGISDNEEDEGADRDTESDKKKPSKGDKNTGHKSDGNKRPDKDGEIKAGDKNTSDEIESMPLKDIEKILSNCTSEIDMECFVAKYANIDTMIEDCDYVLKGTKVNSVFRAADKKDEYDLYADFKVSNVLVNNTDKEVKENILVLEGVRYNKDEEKVTHFAGYRCMEMKKDYILFVKKKSDKTYRIAGIVYGKVPVDANEDALEVDGVFEENAHIVKLKTMISEARDRFMDDTPKESEEPDTSDNKKNASDNKSEPEVTCEPDSSTCDDSCDC